MGDQQRVATVEHPEVVELEVGLIEWARVTLAQSVSDYPHFGAHRAEGSARDVRGGLGRGGFQCPPYPIDLRDEVDRQSWDAEPARARGVQQTLVLKPSDRFTKGRAADREPSCKIILAENGRRLERSVDDPRLQRVIGLLSEGRRALRRALLHPQRLPPGDGF